MKANQKPDVIGFIPTGLTALDELLGGGIAKGKITEISSPFSTGKSTLALQIVANAQKKHDCLYAENEFTYSNEFAKSLGVDVDKLDFIQERLGEDALDAVEEWITNHKDALIILDSVGGILPREDAEKEAGSKSIGTQARLISSFCRRIIGLLSENENALIFLNHQFTDIGTGRLKSSGGEKLAYHKAYWITLRSQFGKQSSRTTDGSKRNKYIEAELKKEKGMNTTEGKKAELILEYGRGFVNPDAVTIVKRGRPAKS